MHRLRALTREDGDDAQNNSLAVQRGPGITGSSFYLLSDQELFQKLLSTEHIAAGEDGDFDDDDEIWIEGEQQGGAAMASSASAPPTTDSNQPVQQSTSKESVVTFSTSMSVLPASWKDRLRLFRYHVEGDRGLPG